MLGFFDFVVELLPSLLSPEFDGEDFIRAFGFFREILQSTDYVNELSSRKWVTLQTQLSTLGMFFLLVTLRSLEIRKLAQILSTFSRRITTR